ncbi:MAG: transcription termination factor NusA [Defluviitaleaceae bacterium]|nr:transcription termination factor NusA [Defluviitaleaceae bacterium]
MIGNSAEFLSTIHLIEKEKGIDKEVLMEAIEAALLASSKKHFGASDNMRVTIDRGTGEIKIFAQKTVVEDVFDNLIEISLEDAKDISKEFELEDVVEIPMSLAGAGRVVAQAAKQVVIQKMREAERSKVVNEYKSKEMQMVSAVVDRIDKRNVHLAGDNRDLVLLPVEQIPGEEYFQNQRLKVVVLDVREGGRGTPTISVSRSHPELVTRLFEQEVPEVADGTVLIRAVAREAGFRSKIAVSSENENVDAVGSCVGNAGTRVSTVVDELNGEKIDIILHSEDPREFIAAALSPAQVLAVVIEEGGKMAKIVVPDNQLSLAIGREGQNARLAAKLTGFRIDIKSESKAKEEGAITEADYLANISKESPVNVSDYAEAAAEYYAAEATGDITYEDDYEYDDYYDDDYDYEYDDDYEYEENTEGDDNQQK